MTRPMMLGCLVCLALSSAAAQEVSPVLQGQIKLLAPATMEFSLVLDGGSVTFRYPASWTFGTDPNGLPPITGANTRAIVHKLNFPGVRSWPTTTFNGAAFMFALQQPSSEESCRNMYSSSNVTSAPSQPVINGFVWSHWTLDIPATGHEEIVNVYNGLLPGGTAPTCLSFNLIVNFLNNAPVQAPPTPSKSELEAVQVNLRLIMESVRIVRNK